MRISTITNWAYATTVVLTALSGASFILSARSADHERVTVTNAWQLDTTVNSLMAGAEQTTEDARLYIIKGDDRYLKAFQLSEGQERQREKAVKGLRTSVLVPQEIAALDAVETYAETLDAIEAQAVKDFGSGLQEKARTAIFGPEHEDTQTALLSSVAHLADIVATRTQDELERAKAQSDLWGAIAKSFLALTAFVFLSVLYFVLKRRVARPLLQMSGIVRRLARQDYDVEILPGGRQDEIGDMNEAIQIFRDNGLERERLEKERQRDRETKDLILQLMHRLQACHDESELGPVVTLYCSRIFPALSGEMLIMNDARTVLRSLGRWGNPDRSDTVFSAEDCWALRRARPHLSDAVHGDIPCHHVLEAYTTGSSLCVPLAAQGDTIGLLHFHTAEDIDTLKSSQVYIELIAENLGLAAANLQLRARLTNLATIDPLTGVLNRRSLDHNLNRLRRENTDPPAALVMIDIDHFKRFNDEFGHEAGDHVMQHVASTMSEITRDLGEVHRFGGEEFAIILRRISRDAASSLTEKIRQAIEATPIIYQGRPLGRVTISAGIASTEEDQPVGTLMSRADAALLLAKSQGRNRVVVD